MINEKLLHKKPVASESINTTELKLEHEKLKNFTFELLEIIKQQKKDFDSLKLRVEELEKNAPALEYTKKFDTVSTDKVYQTPTKGVQIPNLDGYIMFENQAIKSPAGFFIKPLIDGDKKLVIIDNKSYDVRKLHAELHLIPSIVNNNKMSSSDKTLHIRSICSKHHIIYNPTWLM